MCGVRRRFCLGTLAAETAAAEEGELSPELAGEIVQSVAVDRPRLIMQLFEHLAVTPDIQLLINPASSPECGKVWVLGSWARSAF